MAEYPFNEELLKAINTFEPIRGEIQSYRNKIVEKYSWDIDKDIRIAVFEQLDNLIRSLSLSIAVSVRGFQNKKWIDLLLFESINFRPGEKEIETFKVRNNLHTFHKIGYIYSLMQVIEGSIRSIARKTLPNENSTGSFGDLCKKIGMNLKSPKKLNEDMRDALDLLREIRNTIHNNGFYFPDSSTKGSLKINYKGKDYFFNYGNPQGNAHYSVLAQITEDLFGLLKVLIEDKSISKYKLIQGTTGRNRN